MQNRMFPKRGEIWWVKDFPTLKSSIQRPNRPAVVVSNDKCNQFSPVITIVYITLGIKKDLPTHYEINNKDAHGTVMCEQITSIPKNQLSNKLGNCTEEDMTEIEKCMRIQINLDEEEHHEDAPAAPEPTAPPEPEPDPHERIQKLSKALVEAKAEAKLYKRIYDELIEKLTKR